MRKFNLRLTVAILTFITGTTLVSLLFFKDRMNKSSVAESLAKRQITFNLSRTDSGPNALYYYYKSSDGVSLMRAKIDCPTPERANQEFEYKLQLNQNIPPDRVIIERGPKIDSHGQKIGQRAVVVFGSKDHQLGLVVWTDGRTLNWIESPSLSHILELERSEGF